MLKQIFCHILIFERQKEKLTILCIFINSQSGDTTSKLIKTLEL